MKHLLTAALFFVTTTVFCQKADDSIHFHLGPLVGNEVYFETDTSNLATSIKSINDSSGAVAYKNGDGPWVIIDSAATIRVLIESNEQCWKTATQLMAADDVLRYMRRDGSITDRKAFNQAVERYMKSKKPL